jgi:hypothetical protein
MDWDFWVGEIFGVERNHPTHPNNPMNPSSDDGLRRPHRSLRQRALFLAIGKKYGL